MGRFGTAACGAIVAAVAATGAFAQDFVKYGTADGWTVFAKPNDKTCLAERRSDDGMIVQMGVTKDKKLGYLGVFTPDPDNIEDGDLGDIILDIDGALYHSDAYGMKRNITQGYSGAYILANNPAFIDDLANRNTLKAIDHTRVFTMSLAGTKAAIEMGRACIAEQNG